jgi:hypothetical protein
MAKLRATVFSTLQFKVKADRFAAFDLNLRGPRTEFVGCALNNILAGLGCG